MGKKILFSPVGGTDPISAVNVFDGSLLHICRYYRPDKVVLYMSAEVLKLQADDDRYRYCLKKLMELQERKMEISILERPALTEVQDFDYFYDDFRNEIKKIYMSMDAGDELLLNISSGTPAMKSTLMFMGTFGEYPCRLVQVATPVRKMNEHQHEKYDVETLWGLNEDNEPWAENRCSEIKCPSLLMLKQEEMIKQHIAVYDYQAALTVAESMPAAYTGSYLNLLRIAGFRHQLQLNDADRVSAVAGINVFPVRDGNKRKCFEYALMMQSKMKRKEYADFIRGLSPLIFDLFELILKNSCGIDLGQYTGVRNGVRKWDKAKLGASDPKTMSVYQSLDSEFGDFNYGTVYSSHLKAVIQGCSNDSSLKKNAEDLRTVEEKVRNLAAHQIISVDADMIQNLTGFTPDQIMRRIKTAFTYAGLNIRREHWNSYDEMNDRIVETMMKR